MRVDDLDSAVDNIDTLFASEIRADGNVVRPSFAVSLPYFVVSTQVR